MFSNLFRYKLLEKKGGIWVDMDIVCLKPFTFLSGHLFATEMDQTGNEIAATCVIQTPIGAPIMKDCFDKASALASDTLRGSAGPKLLKAQIEAHSLKDFLRQHDPFCPIHWWQTEEIASKKRVGVSFKHSYALHLWREMWRRKGHDSNVPQAGSLYGDLLEHYGLF